MIRVFFCLISLGQCFTSSLAQDEPSLEIDSPTNCMAGQDVTFTVRTSDKAARRYKFVAVYKDVGSEHTVLIRDFAAASACTWRPTLPEEYKVIVSARDLEPATEIGARQATKPFQVLSTFSLDLNVRSRRPLSLTDCRFSFLS